MKPNIFKSYAILAIAAIFLFTGSMVNAAPKGKIEICHKPGQHNQKILSISPKGVAGHEKHGDYLVTPEVCDGLDSDCDIPRVADNDVDCSDGIACTVDSCGGLLGCDNIPDDSLCDDQDPTTSDMCDVPTGGCVNTTIQVCGNGTLETPEQCDDGNLAANDGCSAVCTIEPLCGNNILDPGEQCDDGNTAPGDGCSAVCIIEEFCGDGILDSASGEQCDDGNAIDGDGCSMECEVEVEVSCPCWTAEVLDSVDGFNTDGDQIGIYTQSNPPYAYCEEFEEDPVYINNYIFYRLEEGLGEPFEVCQSGGSSNPLGSGISLRYYGEADARNGLTLEESLACSAEAQACVDKFTQ